MKRPPLDGDGSLESVLFIDYAEDALTGIDILDQQVALVLETAEGVFFEDWDVVRDAGDANEAKHTTFITFTDSTANLKIQRNADRILYPNLPYPEFSVTKSISTRAERGFNLYTDERTFYVPKGYGRHVIKTERYETRDHDAELIESTVVRDERLGYTALLAVNDDVNRLRWNFRRPGYLRGLFKPV